MLEWKSTHTTVLHKTGLAFATESLIEENSSSFEGSNTFEGSIAIDLRHLRHLRHLREGISGTIGLLFR